MAPQLKFLGKRLFLEQMLIETMQETTTNTVKLTLESIRHIFKLLKPSYTTNHFIVNDLLNLIQLSSGKIGVSIVLDLDTDVLKHVWQVVDELTCKAGLFRKMEEVRSTPFDELGIWRIRSYAELDAALKHPAKRLDLGFGRGFSFDNNKSSLLHQNCATQCELNFEYNIEKSNQMSPIVQRVVDTCKELQTLKLVCSNYVGNITDFVGLLNDISNKYSIFTENIKAIRKIAPDIVLAFETYAVKDIRKENFELPEDWCEQINQIDGFENAEIEEEFYEDRTCRTEISVHLKHDRTDAKFTFFVWHHFDDDCDEIE
ncbi:hypothetical protein M3Y97_01071200 [Aphelenchoides bicaudatus]|nr:hypothetical protein M3Y97_01071200 [Aphelenchoides bicaudatus]